MYPVSGSSPVVPDASNLAFVEMLYYDWRRDPTSVPEAWRRYFEGLPGTPDAAPAPESFPRRRADGVARGAPAGGDAAFQARVDRLVEAYREFGHLRARLDPLGLGRQADPIRIEDHGLSAADLDRPVADSAGRAAGTLRERVARLEETYCR
ncbi:MAG TPA: 2-oxoglutarate dehydrogenase E1 component, partial [Anaeromyxobacteraceae bacterium]|nr:2-oxoglutarate dehydrogenase E1 component [Anaeromyxobacteraceae bacterium]